MTNSEDSSGHRLVAREPLRLAQPGLPGPSLDVELPPAERQLLAPERQPGAVRIGLHRRLSDLGAT